MNKTKCTTCGKEIEYKTKPPKQCAECRVGKIKTKVKKIKFSKPKKGSNGSASSKEGLMFDLLDNVLSKYEYINNGYYSWLQSPKHVPMQLDRYYPGLRLGFEFQGKQHYQYNPYFHKTKKQFKYLQECDQLKIDLCQNNNITLVHIKYNKKITEDYLLLKIKEANQELYKKLFSD